MCSCLLCWFNWFKSFLVEPPPPPPTTAEIMKKMFQEILSNFWGVFLRILPILILLVLPYFASDVISFLDTRKFKKKMMKANKDLTYRWKDIHIDEDIKKLLLDNVTRPLAIRQSTPRVSLSPDAALPKGLLFSGPSGTGKTLLAMIVAKESKCNFLSIEASDIRDAYYGESEKKIKTIFTVAQKNQPCILFIDEIDTIMSARKASRGWDVENSIKGVFLTLWDGIYSKNKAKRSSVIVIGATNRPKSLDPAFLRRLDLNIEIPLPNLGQRQKILEIILKESLLEEGFNIKKIVEQAAGFTGSDLAEAARYAIMSCTADYHKELEAKIIKNEPRKINENEDEDDRNSPWLLSSFPFFKESFTLFKLALPFKKKVVKGPQKIPITMAIMEDSVAHSKKSRSRGGGVGGLDSTEMLITSGLIHPCDIDTTWGDIAGCDDVIQNIKNNLILPMKVQMNKKFKVSKYLQCPKGILLHGPPGSGKTLLAKAVARHSGCSFINLQPSMLESKWYGETSQRTAALFSVAEKYQPCIIFMDEIDAFLRERRESDSEHSAGKKAQFLSLLDGILTDPKKVIILMGATNRLEDLDPALLRRLTLKFHIGTPDRTKRHDILQLLLKEEKLSDDVCLERLVDTTEEMTGADLKDILRAAIIESLKENHSEILCQDDFPQSTTTKMTTNEQKVDCIIDSTSTEGIEQAKENNNNTETDRTSAGNGNIAEEIEMPEDAQASGIETETHSVTPSNSLSSDMGDCLEPSISIEIKMAHLVTAIENFKKSKANSTDAPRHMYC